MFCLNQECNCNSLSKHVQNILISLRCQLLPEQDPGLSVFTASCPSYVQIAVRAANQKCSNHKQLHVHWCYAVPNDSNFLFIFYFWLYFVFSFVFRGSYSYMCESDFDCSYSRFRLLSTFMAMVKKVVSDWFHHEHVILQPNGWMPLLLFLVPSYSRSIEYRTTADDWQRLHIEQITHGIKPDIVYGGIDQSHYIKVTELYNQLMYDSIVAIVFPRAVSAIAKLVTTLWPTCRPIVEAWRYRFGPCRLGLQKRCHQL